MADFELEKIFSFHTLTLGDSEDDKLTKAKVLGIDYNEYKRRIIGKEKELEFLLIMRSLRVLKHFEAFDESLSHITNEFTSDYKVEFIDGYKCMIEIKHTSKDEFKISMGNLNNRITFAKRHNIPLRFAISIKGIWGLYTSEQLVKNNGKISIENDFLNSWLDPELGTCSYGFIGKIKIVSIYSTKTSKSMGVRFDPYGELVSQTMYFNNKQIYRAKGKKSKYFKHVLLLGALQDRLSVNQNVIREKHFTIITEESGLEPGNFIPEYKFVLSYIRHLSPIVGVNVKDNISAASLREEYDYPYIEHFREIMIDLDKLGVPLLCSRQKNIYSIKDYAKNIWNYEL